MKKHLLIALLSIVSIGSSLVAMDVIVKQTEDSDKAWSTEGNPITITELGTIYLLEKLGIITINIERN